MLILRHLLTIILLLKLILVSKEGSYQDAYSPLQITNHQFIVRVSLNVCYYFFKVAGDS